MTTQPLNSGGAPASDAQAATSATDTSAPGWWGTLWSSIWGAGTGVIDPLGGLIGGSGSNPLSGAWADIGSGIESGIISALSDFWQLILGPLEIMAGMFFLLVAFLLFFRKDIEAVASAAGPAAIGALAA